MYLYVIFRRFYNVKPKIKEKNLSREMGYYVTHQMHFFLLSGTSSIRLQCNTNVRILALHSDMLYIDVHVRIYCILLVIKCSTTNTLTNIRNLKNYFLNNIFFFHFIYLYSPVKVSLMMIFFLKHSFLLFPMYN